MLHVKSQCWDTDTPLLEDTIWMMMKLIQMEEASLWVNLSRCETGGPECSSVFTQLWRPAPCLLLTEEGVSQGCRSVPRPKHHLQTLTTARESGLTKPEQRRADEAKRVCGVAHMSYDWLWRPKSVEKEKETKTRKQTNCPNVPEYFAALMEKSCYIPVLVFDSD